MKLLLSDYLQTIQELRKRVAELENEIGEYKKNEEIKPIESIEEGVSSCSEDRHDETPILR